MSGRSLRMEARKGPRARQDPGVEKEEVRLHATDGLEDLPPATDDGDQPARQAAQRALELGEPLDRSSEEHGL